MPKTVPTEKLKKFIERLRERSDMLHDDAAKLDRSKQMSHIIRRQAKADAFANAARELEAMIKE